MIKEDALELAGRYNFDHMGTFPVDKMRFMPEVRDMCKGNLCGSYGRSWVCPPALPALEVISQKAMEYSWGILLQTTAKMEDEFDGETMMEARQLQKDRFAAFCDCLREKELDCLPMSSGGCELCPSCTYPSGKPCRFPEKAIPSMEAYGLLVSDVCKIAKVPYYYGRNTVTFTSCVLFREE